MADIAKLITQLDEALRDESTASDLRRVARILIGDPVVQTTIAPPYASTSRVERFAEDLAELRDQVAVLTDMAHGRIRPVDMPDLNGLAVGVNTLHKLVDDFCRRLDKLEDTVNWVDGANMENGHAPNYPANDPDEVMPELSYVWTPVTTGKPKYHLQIEVLTANNKRSFYFSPDEIDFSPTAFDPVVAWRYSKET